MKSTWQKTLAIVLCALLMVTVVAGCQPNEEGGKTTTSSSTTTTSASGDATDPSVDATDPSATDPSATDPSATDPSATDPSATDPSATDPSVTAPSDGTTTGTTASTTKKPTTTKKTNGKNTTSATIKTDGQTTVTTTVTTGPVEKDRATVKVGNLTVHSDKVPYVSGGKMTVTMMLPNSSENVSMSKQAFTKYYEERSGIKMDYQYYAHADIFVLKSTMLNSGNIPDLFGAAQVGFQTHETAKYGKEGFFKDLTPLMETWAPNLYGKLHSGEYNYAKIVTYAPGKVYSLPTLFNLDDVSGRLPEFQPMINTAWLDELGLDIPTTTDEWYEVCKAFTEEDPDGNGKNDTFGYGSNLFGPAMWNPWGLGMSWYVLGTITVKGEILYGPVTDQFREGCRFYNRMWEEGLMCKNMFGCSSAAYKSLVAKTGIVAGAVSNMGVQAALSDSELKNWQVIAWPTGNNLGNFKPGTSASADSGCYENIFFVGKNAKSPEAILRWIDYFYTPDGAMLWHNGPEGVAYTKIGDKYKMMKNSADLAKDQKLISSVSPMQTVNVMERSKSEMTVREQASVRFRDEVKKTTKKTTYNFYWLDNLKTVEEAQALEKLQVPGDWNWGVTAIRGDVDIETDWNSYKNQYASDYTKWKNIYQGIFNRVYK